MQNLDKIGERLKQLRKEKNKSQQEIADLLSIQRQSYSSYENSISMPTIENLRLLAEYFDVSSDYIIGISEQKRPVEVYSASNIHDSNFVQGAGSVTVKETGVMSKEELEMIRIYRDLDVRDRSKLLNYAFDLEDKKNSNSDG